MKVDKEQLDSWTESALQDLLIDLAAVVAATQPGRARNGNDLEGTECNGSRKSPPAWQTCSIAGNNVWKPAVIMDESI
jgi:hypothetical protein